MRTNLEKWNYYMSILNKKADAFMDTINTEIPEIFYKVNLNGSINECTILSRDYSFYMYFTGKNPTKKDIERIKDLTDSEIIFKTDKAFFNYSYTWDNINICKTAIKIKDIFENKFAFLSKRNAEIKAKKLIIQNEEKRLFQETHKKDVNYNYSKNGYKFLGWQNGWKHVYFDKNGNVTKEKGKEVSFGYLKEDYPEYCNCRDMKHQTIEISLRRSGCENIVSCPICMIYWKYDCSG